MTSFSCAADMDLCRWHDETHFQRRLLENFPFPALLALRRQRHIIIDRLLKVRSKQPHDHSTCQICSGSREDDLYYRRCGQELIGESERHCIRGTNERGAEESLESRWRWASPAENGTVCYGW